MKSYLLKMSQSLYITEIYTLRQQNCTKLKIDFFSEILACESLIIIEGGAIILEYL